MIRMVQVGICDDDGTFRDRLERGIQNVLHREGIECKIFHFTSGEDLLAGPVEMDLLFLDYQMAGINGIEAARKIRDHDDKVCIVFVSAFPEYASEGYKVKAYRYLSKTYVDLELEAELLGAVREMERWDDASVTVRSDKGVHRIKCANILYFEVLGRMTSIRTTTGDIHCREPLRAFESRLKSENFFRCHQGYLVNLRYVERISESELEIHGGWKVPVSRYKKKDMAARLSQYWGGMM